MTKKEKERRLLRSTYLLLSPALATIGFGYLCLCIAVAKAIWKAL